MSFNTLLAKYPSRIGNALRYWLSEKPASEKTYRAFPLRILSSEETIRRIREERLSIARYGDGEFGHVLGTEDEVFQVSNKELMDSLSSILQNNLPGLLVCIPSVLTSWGVCRLTSVNERYWRRFAVRHLGNIANICKLTTVYGDSFLSRPYIGWKDAHEHASHIYAMLKQIWIDRRLLIVEGNMSRLGIGNDLFCGCSGIRRILAPAMNAFSVHEQLLQSIITHYQEGELVLLALGPTATVLAAELTKHGIQALDIGHIDIEYCWFKMGVTKKVAVPGKFTNEVENGRILADELNDKQYLSQIIAHIE